MTGEERHFFSIKSSYYDFPSFFEKTISGTPFHSDFLHLNIDINMRYVGIILDVTSKLINVVGMSLS